MFYCLSGTTTRNEKEKLEQILEGKANRLKETSLDTCQSYKNAKDKNERLNLCCSTHAAHTVKVELKILL
jgi:hypothetical protein